MVIGEHLQVKARELLELSPCERQLYMNKPLWIDYLGAQQVLDRLEELIELPRSHRMPNMLVIGPTNNGKTMIKRKFCKIYEDTVVYDYHCSKEIQAHYGKELLEKFVVCMDMPAYPTFKMFLLALCEGFEQAERYNDLSVPILNQEVYRILRKIRVRMLFIDELHNMLASPHRQQLEFLNLIRHIGNELEIPIICLGTKDAYLGIRTDPQLENRFEPFLLPRWKAGIEFNNLLESFISVLPLEYYSDLTDPKIANWLLAKSGGVLGELANILKLAAKRAIRLGREQIDLELLMELPYTGPNERTKKFESMLND